jgi:hypothetical protein
MTEQSNPRYCLAIRRDGSPCKAWGSKTTGLCPAHSPNFKEIAALGGRNKARAIQLEKRLPARLRPVLDLLANAITQVHKGELLPQRAQAMAALASALVRCTEFAELEARLDELEKKVEVPAHAKC